MKKITSTILLTVFLLGLIVPLSASAQPTKAIDCCILKHDIKITEGLKDSLGNDPDGDPCVTGDTDPPAGTPAIYTKQCTKDAPCTFKKGCAIAERGTTADINKCKGQTLGGIANVWAITCLINTISNVTGWLFYLMLVAVVVLVVVGGAMYMMSAGDAEKAGKGKSIIIYGIIGLGIAVFARAVPSIVRLILSV